MKDVAVLRIGTPSQNFVFTMPNVKTVDEVDEMIKQARRIAKAEVDGLPFGAISIYTFIFQNEKVRIYEVPISMQCFIKQENYAYDTPSIQVTNR